MPGKVTSIYQLRPASGSKNGRTTTYTVQFKVKTSGPMGPGELLNHFPVGSPLHLYNSTQYWWVAALNNGVASLQNLIMPWYVYPAAEPFCSVEREAGDPIWDPTNPAEAAWQYEALLSEARIVSRDVGGTDIKSWIVSCTFSDRTRDQGFRSSPLVTPKFPLKDASLTGARFRGRYQRITEDEGNAACDQLPGKFVWSCPGTTTSTIPGCPLPSTLSGGGQVIYPINSVGDPMTKPLKTSYALEEYDVEWFSYTMLNIHCGVGKVNSAPYTLKAYDRPYPYNNTTAFWDQPATVFCRKFQARELLVKDARCIPMNVDGRNCYKYTVTLQASPDFHDAFMVDSGKRQSSRPGSPMPDGSEAKEGDTKGSSTESTPIQDTGGIAGRETFLDGFGYPLFQAGEQVDANKIVYLRYEHRMEIDFPEDELDMSKQYHTYDSNSSFQFLMDGGWRYQYADSDQNNPWEGCDDDANLRPKLPTNGSCPPPESGGDDPPQPESPQT